MCGIIGFNWNDKKLLEEGLKKVRHRGPDASGTFFDKSVSLGHNRLSIVDLSKLGKQPMSNKDGTIWIIFNGEIYNYKSIREKLKKKYNFKSNTDTEVLIYLYEEYGVEMLHRLQGMFAFCIYDSKKQMLFLARDRVGIKPLHYYAKGKKFIFSSEIKGVLEDKTIKREVNIQALQSYLIFRANIEEETFFNGIKKLMPGNYLIYNLKNNNYNIRNYWKINLSIPEVSEKDYLNKLRNLLNDSVKGRLMSDVPYGAYLSGGIDSAIIVSLMKKHSSQKIKTFSVGFKEDLHSEAKKAKFTAEILNTDHHELIISSDAIKKLPEIIYYADEPLADPTAIPIFFLSEYAKKHCTVILTGEGADELFGGYPQYKFMKMHFSFLRNHPIKLRKFLAKAISKTPKTLLNKGFKFASALGDKGLERLSLFMQTNNFSEQYLNQIAIFTESEQRRLLKKPMHFKKYKSFKNIKKNNIINILGEFEFRTSMVDDLLMKIDKNTMPFAVEGRVPYLDHRVAEMAFSIPDKLKIKYFLKDKYLLRKAFSDILPKEIIERKKRHFFVPIDSWLEEYLSNLRKKLLSEQYIKKQGIFNYEYIKMIESKYKSSKLYYARQLWCLIVFQIWHKIYIENEKVTI